MVGEGGGEVGKGRRGGREEEREERQRGEAEVAKSL